MTADVPPNGQPERPGTSPSTTPPDAVVSALASFPTIEADRSLAVSTLAESNDAVAVLVGPAGTGKTFALDAVRTAFETADFTVVGAAPPA